jgi:hypothetical protein
MNSPVSYNIVAEHLQCGKSNLGQRGQSTNLDRGPEVELYSPSRGPRRSQQITGVRYPRMAPKRFSTPPSSELAVKIC